MTKARDKASTAAQTRSTVASAATTADIWSAGSQIDWTGTSVTTNFPAAPQAGAERTIICAAACSFTASASMLIDGVVSGSTVLCAPLDKIAVIALSTTLFKLTRSRADGLSQVGSGSPTYVNSAMLLTAGSHLVDTSAGTFVLTLPAAPATGLILTFTDAKATWGITNWTLSRNGNTIMGTAVDFTVDVSDQQFSIWFNGTDWRLV